MFNDFRSLGRGMTFYVTGLTRDISTRLAILHNLTVSYRPKSKKNYEAIFSGLAKAKLGF